MLRLAVTVSPALAFSPHIKSMRPMNAGTSPDAGTVGNGCPLSPINVPRELKERGCNDPPRLITAGHKVSYHLSCLWWEEGRSLRYCTSWDQNHTALSYAVGWYLQGLSILTLFSQAYITSFVHSFTHELLCEYVLGQVSWWMTLGDERSTGSH